MKFLNWLVFSSENPQETAMTIQGILVLQVPVIVSFLEKAGIIIPESTLTGYVTTGIAIFGAILTIVGLARKLYNTYADKQLVTFVADSKKKKTTKK